MAKINFLLQKKDSIQIIQLQGVCLGNAIILVFKQNTFLKETKSRRQYNKKKTEKNTKKQNSLGNVYSWWRLKLSS